MSPRLHEHVRTLLSSKEAELRSWGRYIGFFFGGLALVLLLLALSYSYVFGPPGGSEAQTEFVVSPEDSVMTIAKRLQEEGYVKYAAAFRFAYGITQGDRTLRPGGYVLSSDMDALKVAKKLTEAPYLVWVSIPEGKRKEEVAALLEEALNWSSEQKREWFSAVEGMEDFKDGVFYADVYLVPTDQPPAQIAARIRERFDDETVSYALMALEKELSWKDVVILASLIEREAAKNDKQLVSGILHNRLERNMLLQVDATLQYLSGSEEGWWLAPDPEDKYTDSPYNTYFYEGLPPEPIATPSLASIEAALNPEETKCLYYLHDSRGRIHCTTNYEAHKANVARYLK